ncbi:hypothetical protein COU61_01180 [Candidatus Pacearchaeota archaeon CG10_big_fil_rev_8_21_14_0_10_35_13]|nr:MAG: hypothetical protein COU61_01180 [Candidatus Pacearchaeota archaeon CG10_big_fil_rev_8_21_14_0_10_35_13]
MIKTIILDTNFIIECLKNKMYYEELITGEIPGARIVVPEEVINELRKIKENNHNKTKDREAAALAMKIAEKHEMIKLGKKYVDKGIIEYCKKHENIIVATIDKRLKKELKEKAKVITLRGRKGLIVE